ncbi:hypothetical protein B0H12DRAFT_278315 [Mycena haematopus]|nr:hypothetical protein B0H12DRAFT_278315 [Mycena haematopus]
MATSIAACAYIFYFCRIAVCAGRCLGGRAPARLAATSGRTETMKPRSSALGTTGIRTRPSPSRWQRRWTRRCARRIFASSCLE